MKTMFPFIFIILFGMISGTRPPTTVKTYTFGHENVLGTSLDLNVTAVDPGVARKAERIALAEIDRLNNILSSYQPGSEFSQWQRTRGVDVNISPELFEVLSLFDKWKTRTGGALSATAGIGVALWKKAETLQSMPDEMEISRVRELMHQEHWALDHVTKTARHLSGEPLLLNSFVKSYIVGKVATKVMSIPGVTGCVVNIGGDIVVSGAIQERVLVADPEADAGNAQPLSTLSIANKAIATSGNYRRGYTIN
jgi:FAD:protein FMN transferase